MRRFAAIIVSFLLSQSAFAWDGVVEWSRKVTLGPPVSGIVTRVDATPGSVVKKGEVLLALDATPFEANVAEARAALARARISRDEANRDLKQAEELYARTVLSTVELENARMKQGRAQATVAEAQAALTRAEYQLRVSAVRAPFDAIVLSVQAQPGQAVVAGLEPPMLVTVAARGEFLAVVAAPAADTAKLAVGQKAKVSVGDRTFEGRVQAIGFEPKAKAPETGYEVRVLFSADDGRLRAGLPAKVEVP